MTMEGCRGGDLVAPMSLRYLSIQPDALCLFAPPVSSPPRREGRMDAMRGHWQQKAQFQERPYERQGPVDGVGDSGSIANSERPFAASAGTPLPCDAMA